MNHLSHLILSLALGIGSCSNLSSSPEGLEAKIISGKDIDLPTTSSEELFPDTVNNAFPDTTKNNAQNHDSFLNLYSPEIRSQQYFFTTVEDHYSFGTTFSGLSRLKLIKDFAGQEGLTTQLVDTEGYFLSVCDHQDILFTDICELNLLQSEEAQLVLYQQNGSGESSVLTIICFEENFGDGLVPVYFNPDLILSPSGL